MSSLAITNTASTTLPSVNLKSRGPGHHRGLQPDAATQGSSSAQIPVGGVQNLFANLLQTLEQVIGIQPAAGTSAVAATGAAAGTSAASAGTNSAVNAGTGAASSAGNTATAANGFLHSLFQVLKQDGLGSGTGAQASSSGAVPPSGTASSPAGQYQGSLVSSLQTLIQQVGSGSASNPEIANLETSFNNLTQGSSGNAAAGANSNAGLQSFLNSLLQNLQASGLQAPKLTGSNVNTNV